MSYRFKGCIIENSNGDVLKYTNSNAEAVQICTNNNIPLSQIRKVYVFETPVYKTEADRDILLYEPDANGILVETKEQND